MISLYLQLEDMIVRSDYGILRKRKQLIRSRKLKNSRIVLLKSYLIITN